jgi:uncharacterized protein YbcI
MVATRVGEIRGVLMTETDFSNGSPAGRRDGQPLAGDGEPPSGINPLLAISNEMVRIYKDQFGRGPTKTRTDYAGPNTLVCLLENTFTPAERNLQAMGEHQRLRDIRMLFQYADSSRFIEPVERITGRRVTAFVSGIDTNADVACELFVLEPEATPPDQG